MKEVIKMNWEDVKYHILLSKIYDSHCPPRIYILNRLRCNQKTVVDSLLDQGEEIINFILN
jgi:hypothetical protein